MKILILCTGNSCRSQMAQAFLQSFAPEIEVRSAGTEPARSVHPMAIEVMKEAGIDISGNSPENVSLYLDDEWDYVITVCGGAAESCPAFLGKVKHRMHIGFDDPALVQGTEEFVRNEFRRIRDEIHSAFQAFYLDKIKTH
jgi:arsenate reductase (thioredoxin)